MQFNPPNPTIEGDLFDAFIKAGAVSKANSNDPKKSAFARCARTDKGVHAAGNLISLKMIIEDEDILEKINSHLPETIRVWGIQRTTGSFSCYQLCDSRKYEYLLPSHVFLPPHPSSFLGKQLRLWAEKEGKMAEWEEEQKDVSYFWDTVKAKVQPLLEGQDAETVAAALEAVVSDDEAEATGEPDQGLTRPKKKIDKELYKKIRAVHIAEKKAYRCSPERLERLRKMLEMYVGTKNFHNYTINKSFKDASAKRHIKSFVALDPIIVGDTEWIRTRVHGQSFMMHQIR
jgi:tRNA pseudouridine38-40 synthase